MTSRSAPTRLRGDLAASLACHAAVIGGLVLLGGRLSPMVDETLADALEENTALVADADAAAEVARTEAVKAAETKADAAASATPAAPTEPVRTAEETGRALVGAEVKQSVTMAVPADAPESVKSELAAALDRALAEAMKTTTADGKASSRAEIEMAAAERVAGTLRSEVNEAFAESAAKDFSRRAFESALNKLEKAAEEVLGPKERELLAAEGAVMAGDDASQAAARAAELAIYNKDAFQKELAAQAKRVLGEVAPAALADTAAEIVQKKLDEKGVKADAAAMAKLREEIGKGVAANAAGRGFNTGAVWKPSNELILPGTKRKKGEAALDAKVGEVATKQAELIASTLPGLAAEAAKAARWNEHFNVSRETDAKIATLHRLETHMANLKAGRGGAAEAGLASALAALLGNDAGGPANESDLDFEGSGRWGSSGRNFKEDEYRKLLARLEGRPANAGAEPDLQRVAGEPVNAGAAGGGLLPPERIVTLHAPAAAPAPDAAPAVIAPPPFPSATHTAAPYATQRPVLDGDLSDWNPAAPRAEVRLLENNTRLANGPDVFLQWRAEGLYFAYRLADAGGIQVSDGAPYHGDIVELFVDSANSRAPRMRDSNSAHQYFFMPFGYKGDPTRTFQRARGKVAEPAGRDLAALNSERSISFCTAKKEAGGYAVEGFLSIAAMERRLAPGIYLGFDVSVSPDFDFKNQMQWAAAKSLGNWDRPSTWGDLLLLGTSARLSFRGATGETRTAAAAGETLVAQVDDADMNLDAAARETVAVKLSRADGSGAQVLLLTETGADTGVFQGPCALLGAGAAPSAGRLEIGGGDSVLLTYIDAVTAGGARNQPAAARLEIGFPVLRLITRAPR